MIKLDHHDVGGGKMPDATAVALEAAIGAAINAADNAVDLIEHATMEI